MDPITGIGLAASVIQLVTFGISAAQTCKTIYEQGVLDDNSQVEYVANHLASLTASTQQSLRNSNTQSLVLFKEERELVDLSRRCEIIALKLQQELRGLETRPHTSIVQAASKAARALWKKNSIEKIRRELESYRSTLEISLLSRLSQRFDAQALKSDERFASLDKSQQHIIECLAKSETTLATISIQEAEKTRQYTAAQIGRLEKVHVDDHRFEEVTRSLFYPEIFSRQEQIDSVFDGIKSSYDWIFDEPRTSEIHASNQDNPDTLGWWFRNGHGVYWINGKAGSGKSTLMNHICSHKRRVELLKKWSLRRQLLTPSFFFWNSGSRQQKTIDGLLRSLIYQMLTECRQLVACCEDRPIHAWTESRLLTFLFNLLRQTQVDVAICMFIDGLDEFDGHYDRVIERITELSDQRHVKICVSSRPLLAFEMAFKGKPSLRLQDLTFNTIREYTDKQLSHLVQQHASSNEKTKQRAEKLLQMIVHRADGVFLWAVIAAREVREGLQGMVNLDELAHAIEVLPPELEDLFMLVLKRIKLAFRPEAAKLLQIVLFTSNRREFNLCRLSLISSQQERQDAPFVYENVTMSEVTEACRILKTRLLSHTAGLLELTPKWSSPQMPCKRKDWDPISFTTVDFIHRTVRDFLTDNNEAKSFLSDYGLSEAQVHICIARGTFADLALISRGDAIYVETWPHPMLWPFQYVLRHVSIAERLSRSAQSKLIQSLDYASLVRGYTSCSEPYSFRAFWKTEDGDIVDIVGMAAGVDMKIYVCEQLDLSVSSAGYYPSLPDLKQYSRSKARAGCLSWERVDRSTDTTLRAATLFRPSDYRQALGKCLRWEEDTPANSRPDDQTEYYSLAESYILRCCRESSMDLVRILLKAGANPMVRVRPMDWKPRYRHGDEVHGPGPFWEAWLLFLQEMRHNYMVANGNSGGLLLGKSHLDRHITLGDIFDVTKALLANGADINYQIEEDKYSAATTFLQRHPVDLAGFFPRFSCSAMFLLEECFNKEPEFREFAVAIRPLVKTPIRRIIRVLSQEPYSGDYADRNFNATFVVDSEKESKLRPPIEKWESTGHEKDRVAVVAALEQIWGVLKKVGLPKEDWEKESEEEYPETYIEWDTDEGFWN